MTTPLIKIITDENPISRCQSGAAIKQLSEINRIKTKRQKPPREAITPWRLKY